MTLQAVEKIVYSSAFASRTSVQFRTWLFWNPNVVFSTHPYQQQRRPLVLALRYSKIDTPLKSWQKILNDRAVYSTNSQGICGLQWCDTQVNPRYLNSTLQFRKDGVASIHAPKIILNFPDPVVIDSFTFYTSDTEIKRGRVELQISRAYNDWSGCYWADDKGLYTFYNSLYSYTTPLATKKKVAYYETYYTATAMLGAAYQFVINITQSSTPYDSSVNVSALTLEVSPSGLQRSKLCKERLGLGLSNAAFSKLFASVIAKKRCILADYLISNMRSLYSIPNFANEIYTVASDSAVDAFFSRVSKKSGVYDETCTAIGGESTNIELLVQITNFLNLKDTTLPLLKALQGDIFASNALQIDGEVQDVATNGLGFSFLHPVAVKAVHFVWISDKPPTQPSLRVVWKCGKRVVCDTKEVIAHKCRKVFSPTVYVVTFPVVAKYPFQCRKWSVWLGGKFSENKIFLKKIIIELHKGKKKQWKSI